MGAFKSKVMEHLPRGQPADDISAAYLKRRVMAVPMCAVQSGSFRHMERTSTLLFADFVLSNVISLLIVN